MNYRINHIAAENFKKFASGTESTTILNLTERNRQHRNCFIHFFIN